MTMLDLEPKLREAVRHFWRTRQSQSTRQADSEDRDRGGRGAVTGGKQMDGFVRLVPSFSLWPRCRKAASRWTS